LTRPLFFSGEFALDLAGNVQVEADEPRLIAHNP